MKHWHLILCIAAVVSAGGIGCMQTATQSDIEGAETSAYDPEPGAEVAVTEAALTGDRHIHAYAQVFASGQLRAGRNHNIERVEHLERGRYRVTVVNTKWFKAGLGNFQVVATGTTANRCK